MSTPAPYERLVCLPDIHGYEVDRQAFGCALSFVKLYDPHVLVLLGDVLDFPSISKYPRDPSGGQMLQGELDFTIRLLEKTREVAPNARIYYLRGNHENRINKYLWTRAAEMWPLRCLRVPELLSLRTLDIEYVEEGRMRFHGIELMHGEKVAQKAGYTAHREMQDHWISGVSGHTHRCARVSHTAASGRYVWIESGCLCKLRPEWMEGRTPNWQHALTWGEFKNGGDRFRLQVEEIISGKIVWQGQEVSHENRKVR